MKWKVSYKKEYLANLQIVQEFSMISIGFLFAVGFFVDWFMKAFLFFGIIWLFVAWNYSLYEQKKIRKTQSE
jgi:hypothetical protein